MVATHSEEAFEKVTGGAEPPLRPFYFMVVLWGKRFRDYFLDFCLPTLLAPNNIPALKRERRSKFLICTTPEDWSAIAQTPIFAQLKRYAEPTFIEIPAAPPGVSGCQHMGVGHKKAMDLAFRDKAYGILVTPDYMVNDGAVAALQRHAENGKRLVLVSALRFGEEPLFENLTSLGLITPRRRLSQEGEPLVFTGRQLVAAGIRGFHSETIRYGWESPCFSDHPEACWWPVADGSGIVVHGTSWTPLLMDYATLERHDTTALEEWTFDGDYLYKNFGSDLDRVYVVTDSDEIMQVSWAPLSDRAHDLTPIPSRNGFFGGLTKGAILRGHLRSGRHDPLKHRLLFITVRWHERPLSYDWRRTERKAKSTLRLHVGDLEPDPASDRSQRDRSGSPLSLTRLAFEATGWLFEVRTIGLRWLSRLHRLALRVPMLALRVILHAPYWLFTFVLRSVTVTLEQFAYADRMARVVKRALCGDVVAWRRISRRVGRYGRAIAGVHIENE
jgi:hypothetical protein